MSSSEKLLQVAGFKFQISRHGNLQPAMMMAAGCINSLNLVELHSMKDPTLRFSSRAENYVQYRPRYPKGVIETLRQECKLTPFSLVADIGSGTGALTELFLQNGNLVYAVEPNREMRETAEKLLRMYPGFRSIAGRAEATTLEDASLDFAVVGQAFHWFNVASARREFLRILKPSGWAMIVWNEREFEKAPFLRAYDQLLQRYAPEYAREKHKGVYDNALKDFYGSDGFIERAFNYRQELSFEGVKGRMLSASYAPEPGHPNHEPLMAELAKAFQACQIHGRVTLEYITRMYYGRLSN